MTEAARSDYIGNLPDNWRTWTEPDRKALLRVLQRSHFRRTYEFDPVAFVNDCFDWDRLPPQDRGLAPYQEETLALLPIEHRVAIRGPHGLGKSATFAWALLWFSLTRDGDDWKCLTMASVRGQLRLFLWPEIHKWARLLRFDVIGRDPFIEGRDLLDEALKLDTGEASALASNDPGRVEGAHADRIFYEYDEAKGVPGDTIDASEGAMSNAGPDTGKEAFQLMGSTPGDPHGRFYEINQRRVPGWKLVVVTKEMAIAAGRMSQAWVDRMAETWGTHSATFVRRVEGRFAAGDEQSVLPQAWVEFAVDRWIDAAVPVLDPEADGLEGAVFANPSASGPRYLMLPEELAGPLSVASMDVADQGEDRTAIATKHAAAILRLRTFHYDPDPMEATGELTAILRGADSGFPVLDAIGVGAGPLARLRELRDEGTLREAPVPFIANARSDALDASSTYGFHDLRAEAWWGMHERLHPTKGDDVMLPPSDELIAELVTPRWRVLSGGKIMVESKDDLRKKDRLGRSPDLADAVVMAYWARPAVAYSQTGRGRRIPGM